MNSVLTNSKRSASDRGGFTLVEILVSIVITGIIGSMLAVAITGANRQAKDQRAEAMIDRLNLLLLQIYEEETERAAPEPGLAVSAEQRALLSLNWKRDWLRCTLPDRREDVGLWPIAIQLPVPNGATLLDDGVVPMLGSGASATGLRHAAVYRYRTYIASAILANKNITVTDFDDLADGNPANGEWTSEHQSAECLYLILKTHLVFGEPAIDSIHPRFITDTDDDGVPEVLDPFEQPLGFMRWPVGYYLTPDWDNPVESPETTTTRADWQLLAEMKDELGRDPIDILYVDPRYTDNGLPTDPPFAQAEDPFPLYPMVVSAGADGVFDLYGLDNDEALTPVGPPVINYPAGGWPNTSPTYVQPFTPPPTVESPTGFPNTYAFIDPYMDGAVIGQKLGARMDTNGDGDDNTGDNVMPDTDFL